MRASESTRGALAEAETAGAEAGDAAGAEAGVAARAAACDQAGEQRRRQAHGRDAASRRSGRHLAHQVSAVSTVRLAAPRYSTERISRSRDTVRGNSCASGPSVYSPSGSTAAETMSLTRRS